MLMIELTQGKVALVDDIDFIYLNQWKWFIDKNCKHSYAVRDLCSGKRIYMHRVILERMGFENFEETDHIDRDTLNNQRYNLRSATRQQNSANHKLNVNNVTGFRGICYTERLKPWMARISVNGRYKFLGRYETAIEAAKAYDKAAVAQYGDFAALNFPKK